MSQIHRVFVVAYFLDFENPGVFFQLSQKIRVGTQDCLFLKPASDRDSSPELVSALLDAFRAGREIQVEVGAAHETVRFGEIEGLAVQVKKLYIGFQ